MTLGQVSTNYDMEMIIEPPHDKTNKVTVRPAKIQTPRLVLSPYNYIGIGTGY